MDELIRRYEAELERRGIKVKVISTNTSDAIKRFIKTHRWDWANGTKYCAVCSRSDSQHTDECYIDLILSCLE